MDLIVKDRTLPPGGSDARRLELAQLRRLEIASVLEATTPKRRAPASNGSSSTCTPTTHARSPEKAGFAREGIVRDASLIDSVFRDAILMAI